MENTINLSEVKKLIATAHATLCVVIHALDTKVLVGEINRPSATPPPKIKRKRRTKKEIMQSGQRMELTPRVKMDLEKEYQSGRTSDLILPEGNTFYTKKKREKRVEGES